MRRERFTEQADAITFDGEVMWRKRMPFVFPLNVSLQTESNVSSVNPVGW